MKKAIMVGLAIACVGTGIGMGAAIRGKARVERELAELSAKTESLRKESQARVEKERAATERKIAEHQAALVATRERMTSEWRSKTSQARAKAQPLLTEQRYVQRWRSRQAHLEVPSLALLQEGEPNKVNGRLGRYLESFTLSDTSLRFDYHNTTSGRLKPDFTIHLFDSDGRRLDTVSVSWLFDRIAPGAWRSEVKTVSRRGRTPCYYRLLEE